jgi:alpha-galactosidase
MSGTLDLSHPGLHVTLDGAPGSALAIGGLGLPGADPMVSGGPAFGLMTGTGWLDGSGVTVDRLDVRAADNVTTADNITAADSGATDHSGVAEHVVRTTSAAHDLRVDWHVATYPGTPVVEVWPVVRNQGTRPVAIERLDSFAVDLPPGPYDVLSFSAAGSCAEFAPAQHRLDGPYRLESLSGRSSHGDHPWFVLRTLDGRHVLVGVAWSGNWVVRFDPLEAGGHRISGGLHDQGFRKRLCPAEQLVGPRIVLAFGREEVSETAAALCEVGRRHWYPPVDGDFPPMEWNHWWPYVDKLDEATFLANVDAAADLGLELCTLDAGWYGPTDPAAPWFDYRGDWDTVNTHRFPSGIRALADHVHRRGMRFGLWCETDRPDLPATRAGEHLGYVCFANPAGRSWAADTLDRLIVDYACDWVKLDFNVDPGLGCDRTDHGHDEGDGLFEHYRGYYAMLDELRARHPRVVLENCSSGGLRLDLEMARHTHLSYLSDPDWPEHSLQVFWGTALALAPDRCLHWAYSEWWDPAAHPRQRFDPTDPELTEARLDFYTRLSMLHGFGLSQKLPDLPGWVVDRYRTHIGLYRDVVRGFVQQARVLTLTGQPLRDGLGDRWAAFQYVRAGGRDHLLFVFRLDGAEPERTIRPRNLDPVQTYVLRWLGSDRIDHRTGADLATAGLRFDGLGEEESALLRIEVADRHTIDGDT